MKNSDHGATNTYTAYLYRIYWKPKRNQDGQEAYENAPVRLTFCYRDGPDQQRENKELRPWD